MSEIIEFPKFPDLKPATDAEFEKFKKDYRYVFEYKMDGTAGMVGTNSHTCEIRGRGEQDGEPSDYTNNFPEIVDAFDKYQINMSLFQGEICVFDDNGSDNINRLQTRPTRKKDIEKYMKLNPAKFMIFDLLRLNGRNLQYEKYVTRRRLLSDLIKETGLTDHPCIGLVPRKSKTPSKGLLWKFVRDNHREGITMKNKLSKYGEGMYKYKVIHTEEAWIDGYEMGTGRLEKLGLIGSLHLYQMVNGKPTYVGKTGSGLNDACREEIMKLIRRRGENSSQKIIVEVAIDSITPDGKFRMPRFKRLRFDKGWQQCVQKYRR